MSAPETERQRLIREFQIIISARDPIDAVRLFEAEVRAAAIEECASLVNSCSCHFRGCEHDDIAKSIRALAGGGGQ